jgi:hypothetical protein
MLASGVSALAGAGWCRGAVLVWVEDAGKGCEGGVGDDGGDGGRASSRDGQVDGGE